LIDLLFSARAYIYAKNTLNLKVLKSILTAGAATVTQNALLFIICEISIHTTKHYVWKVE